MANTEIWTSERIGALLREESFSYQNVPLPGGLSTGGEDRSATAALIFPPSLAGQSIFDLGSMYGYFCFAAEERGAVRMVGADIDPENVRKSKLLAACRQSKAEFIRFDIETDAMPGVFDHVLCLNVLHHLRNPLSALDKMISATRRSLIFEVAGFAGRDRKKNGVSLPLAMLLSKLPVLYTPSGSSQTMFITIPALRVLLMDQRYDFARFETIAGGHKGRSIVIAHRRRVKKLVVIAGMPAGGKTTFIDHLFSSEGKEFAASLGIDSTLQWQTLHFGDLRKHEEDDLGNVILHYNVLKHVVDGDLYQHSRALSDLLSVSEQATFVTINRPREELLEHFSRERANLRKSISSGRARKKMKKVIELYESEKSLNDVMGDWYQFLRNRGEPIVEITRRNGNYQAARR